MKSIQEGVGQDVSLGPLLFLYCFLTAPEVPEASSLEGASDVLVTRHEQEASDNTADLQLQPAFQSMPILKVFVFLR